MGGSRLGNKLLGILLVITLLPWTNLSISNSPAGKSIAREIPLDSVDKEPPKIENISYTHVEVIPSEVNISAKVTDNVGVKEVRIYIRLPQLPDITFNQTMNRTSGTDIYYFTFYVLSPGRYNFTIWATDVSGNVNSSTVEMPISESAVEEEPGYLGDVSVIWSDRKISIIELRGVANITSRLEDEEYTVDCSNNCVFNEDIKIGYTIYCEDDYNYYRVTKIYINCKDENGNPLTESYSVEERRRDFGRIYSGIAWARLKEPIHGERNTTFLIRCEIRVEPTIEISFLFFTFSLPWLKEETFSHNIIIRFR